jgi:hypothetical protein
MATSAIEWRRGGSGGMNIGFGAMYTTLLVPDISSLDSEFNVVLMKARSSGENWFVFLDRWVRFQVSDPAK